MRALLPILLLSACAVADPYEHPTSFRVTYDPSCGEPTEDDHEALHRAAWMWLGWGIEVSEDFEEGDAAELSVCLRDGRLPGNYGGRAFGPDDEGQFRIIVNRKPSAWQYYYGTLAHEIGHLVLRADERDEHLPLGQVGIMSSDVDCPDDTIPFDCRWSADDLVHLESFGLSRGDEA